MTVARYRLAAWVSLGFTLLVIAWGALVRATGSGAGCGNDWPTCHGALIPETTNVATAIEFGHRVTSGLAFLLVLGLFVFSRRVFRAAHPARQAAAAAVVFMVLEAAVGAGLVLLDLVADNLSVARAVWMAIHLLNTFLLLAAQALLVWWADGAATRPRFRGQPRELLAWLGGGLASLLVVGVSGAVTALGDTLFPAGTLSEGIAQDLAPTAHFLIQLRVFHPLLAALAGLLVLFGARRLAQLRPSPLTSKLSLAVTVLFLTQLMAGFVNLALLAPLWLQLVHLMLADAIWLSLVWLGAEALQTTEPERAGPRQP